MIGYALIVLAVAVALWAQANRPVQRVRAFPRTFAEFCNDPRPLVAEDVELRDGDVATVYNMAAVTQFLSRGQQ